MTHEQYLFAVRDLAISKNNIAGKNKEMLENIKLVYGHNDGKRGFTCHDSWEISETAHAVVQVCLNAEESLLQLAGTTLHELGHVIAGRQAGHGQDWKDACKELGLLHAKAVGTNYHEADMFSPKVLAAIKAIPKPTDGKPRTSFEVKGMCGQGLGTHGGKSRGKGSGSRLKKLECPRCGYTARTTKKWIEVGLPTCPCGMKFIDL